MNLGNPRQLLRVLVIISLAIIVVYALRLAAPPALLTGRIRSEPRAANRSLKGTFIHKPSENKAQNQPKQTSQKQLSPTKLPAPDCQFSNLDSLATVDASPNSPIPKVVHWIYKTTSVPEQYLGPIRSCLKLNPDHTFVFWTDASALEFVKAKYPAYHYLFVKHFTSGLEFSDALRYFILLHFGGIYLDLDVDCVKPFSSSLTGVPCILDREREVQTRVYWNIPYYVMNSVMACQRNHPLYQQAIELLKVTAIKEKGVIERTGPGLLTKHWQRYVNSTVGKTRPVTLAPSTLFSPLMDVNHFPIFRRICESSPVHKGLRQAACEEYKKNGYSHGNIAELTKNSITIHRYMHLGWSSWQFKIRTMKSVCKAAPVLVFKA